MNKFLLTLAATTLASLAFAQSSTIYTPTRSLADQGITTVAWGSGTIAETDEMAFEGTTSVRVSSRNFYQGGIMKFATPVDLSTVGTDPNNLLLITFQIPTDTTVAGTAGGDRTAGSGMSAGGALAGGGQQGESAPAAPAIPPINRLRIVLTTADGKKSEAYLDLSSTAPDARGWRRIGIPLQAISGFSKTDMKVTQLSVSVDSVGSVYIGQMEILNDSTPIYGETNVQDLNLAFGDEVVLAASGQGGATQLKYTWDFDSSDGIQVDAEGQAIRRKFRKPGTFTVTLTISDVYGLKPSFSTTFNVTVNP